MNIIEIITKKKNKETLTYEELSYAFNGYLKKDIPDYQMSALLMAITINGLSFEETSNLTKIFIDSGEVFHFDKLVCDKHSTGGIGDTVTFIIAPILAALDIPIAKMSGRGLGITGGTIDKLESIPGFNFNLSFDDFNRLINECNIAIGAQTDSLVPLDKVIYALRDVTGTTESIPLIASSIMSKKIASGAKYIVIDVKCGEGALLKTREDANKLSEWLVNIGSSFNVKVKTIVTDMDEPLSDCIGNAVEVLGAVQVLQGKKGRLRDVACEVAGTLVSMYKDISLEDGIKDANTVLDNGKALESFNKWIAMQGGDLTKLEISPYVFQIKSKSDGVVENISALKCGKLALKLGAGRMSKNDTINYGVGIKLLKNNGDAVQNGDILYLLYSPTGELSVPLDDLDIYTIKSQ